MTEIKNPELTEPMIEATKTLLAAMAWVRTVRPIVRGYQKKILEKHQFTNKGTAKTVTS